MKLTLYRCELVPEDFLFFVSREFNTYTQVLPHIHNYALTYALGTQFIIGSVGNEPKYSELEYFDLYATPALPESPPSYVGHMYNSVCSRTNITQSALNVPALGRISKIAPMSAPFSFMVFALSNRKPPFYVRVGKKSCICRIWYEELPIEKILLEPDETITTTVCFNPMDLSVNDIVYSADIIMTYPSPIARSMTVMAPYLEFKIDDEILSIPIPKHLRKEGS